MFHRLFIKTVFIFFLIFFAVNPNISKGEETSEKPPDVISPAPIPPLQGEGKGGDGVLQGAASETPAEVPVPESLEKTPAEVPTPLSPEAGLPVPVPLPAEETLPLPPQEGTVALPAEEVPPPRGLFTRLNEDFLKKIELRGYLKS